MSKSEDYEPRMMSENLINPYQQLRSATLARDRGLREKVMSLEEAAKLVRDGDHVGIGGCTMSRTPMAMVWALIRARRKDLTVSRSITSTEGDLLFASGASRHIVTSWFSQGIVWGVSKVMRHFTENKLARFEEWSHMSLGLRYRAGAMGIPFMPSRSMIGSDVSKRVGDAFKTMECPFTGDRLVLLPALNPDVVLIHVQRCDAFGNAQLDGLQFMDIDMAMAANRVILTTERIVSNDQIRRMPDQTRIPFFTVEAVVEAPIGCAPHECYGVYEPFFAQLDAYAGRTAKDALKGCCDYLDEFYYGPNSWADYLAKIGMDEVLDACRRGRSVHND
jgi:glutaconate CoA-transferase, subunit A